jgi:tRNA-dihydrouridine synthase
VPVTLKIRTGWDADHRNGPAIARIAADMPESRLRCMAVHAARATSNTRPCRVRHDRDYQDRDCRSR